MIKKRTFLNSLACCGFALLLAAPGFAKPAADTDKDSDTSKMTAKCAKEIEDLDKKIAALERQVKACGGTTIMECGKARKDLAAARKNLKATRKVCAFAKQNTSSLFSGLDGGAPQNMAINLNPGSGKVSNLSGGRAAMPAAAGNPPAPKAAITSPKKPESKGFWDDMISRGGAVGRSVWDIGKGITGDLFGIATEVPKGLAKDLGKAGKDLLSGKFGDAAKGAVGAVGNALTRTVGGVVDAAARTALGAVDILDTAILHKPLPRKLTSEEKNLLDGVYKGSIDLDKVYVRQGSTSHLFLPAHVVGNTIYFKDKLGDLNNPDGTLTYDGRTLVHETGHVWQNQNGGGDYLHKAIFANVKAAVTQGDRNKAYEWKPEAAKGTPFSQLNPEQQATVIDNLAADELRPAGKKWLTPEETKYAREAMELVRAGKGAP